MNEDVPKTEVGQPSDPFDELHEMDLRVELAGMDDEDRAFNPDVHPKEPTEKEEGTTGRDGRQVPVEDALGMFFEQDVQTIEDIMLEEETL